MLVAEGLGSYIQNTDINNNGYLQTILIATASMSLGKESNLNGNYLLNLP